MHNIRRIAAATTLSLTLAMATVGCAKDDIKSTPELPDKFCWNAFEKTNVQPYIIPGEKMTQDSDTFYFTERKSSTSCLIHVDGKSAFSAFARFQDDKIGFDWSSFDRLKPNPVKIGEKGIVWNTGGRTYFPCKATENSDLSTAKYLELEIFLSGTQVENHRKTLPDLLKQFTAFAQKELRCG
ncbi:hypothetical protein [Streptomyces anulatus]|uniref:hypothetical protein n=1 Tax=Streptomyces anulatus TaxID=1892 RepID=UPI0036DC41E5